tara:strand:+ start:217 stop:681 length:465 start_codon:yes stop_codon:yes gene_type:complete
MEHFSKQEWSQHIHQVLADGRTFQSKVNVENRIFALFAADTFRRNGHEVLVDIMPTETGISSLIITIFPIKKCIEFTLRRDIKLKDIIQQIEQSNCTKVSLRGCGTVIHSLFQIMDWALHSGWYVDNTIMNTLTQQKETIKQRNTTLYIVIRKG